jgi:hypothetical protein
MFDKLFSRGSVYINSHENMKLSVLLHAPYTMTKDGTLLNDNNTTVNFVNLQLIEAGETSIFINGSFIPKRTNDSVYTIKLHDYVANKIQIDIESIEHAELLAVEYDYLPAHRL